MSDNKRTVEKYMEGFRHTDRDAILSCVTDDVQWEIPGMFQIQGRDAFNSHIVDSGFAGNPIIEITRMMELSNRYNAAKDMLDGEDDRIKNAIDKLSRVA